jgi:hypothetical protein
MEAYDQARQLVQILLKGVPDPTLDRIREAVDKVLPILMAQGADINREALIRELEASFNVWVSSASVLHDPKGHEAWLPARRSQIKWRFWKRYERYLEEELAWAPKTVAKLDEMTDLVLEKFEDPNRAGPWDRRGMVVGHVQSGKTSHYTGLICKAVDAGYKLIIILAGMHKNLRSQTQLRLDEGFLGFDTQKNRAYNQNNSKIGAGAVLGADFLIAHSLTSSADGGDFNRTVANTIGVVPGGNDPVILVVKKNGNVLQNLINWATSINVAVDRTTGQRLVRDVPLLVIDDEADNASINTNPKPVDENGRVLDDETVTAINGRIRKLLNSFEKSVYVGYTATPFANIFIYPQGESDEHGEDLFPRSFIINLPVPSNYIGPAKIFGYDAGPDGREAQTGLPIVRTVDDYEEIIPNGHKKELQVTVLPDSLKRAIKTFVLTCAARMCRGQVNVHNSMLVHVTRFKAVQEQVASLVDEERRYLVQLLEYMDSASSAALQDELRRIWEDDFEPTTAAVVTQVEDPLLLPISWNEVRSELFDAASRIQVKTINGSAKDALDYRDNPKGMFVVAVGGDKLSRGLTLEGLSVSYFLRASKMYDTLMQMGRWFGYRPGYLDLCRLFTSQELSDWYRHIAAASDELREEFDHMAAVNGTPMDYGLRVRQHPNGLLVTAVNKMRSGTPMQLSYAGSFPETVAFDASPERIRLNFNAFETFLRSMGKPGTKDGNHVWTGVPGTQIVALLRNIVTHKDSLKAQASYLARYIEAQLPNNELTDWTVALISSSTAAKKATIADLTCGLIVRAANSQTNGKYSIKRLVSPKDETIDLTESQLDQALELTRRNWKENPGKFRRTEPPDVPAGPFIRDQRSVKNGLLLIYPLDPEPVGGNIPVMGFAMSFPDSEHAVPVEYLVNNIYWQQEFGEP